MPESGQLDRRSGQGAADPAAFERRKEGKLNRQGVLQGGAIATLLDAAAGYAGIFAESGAPARHAFTLSLTTNYLDKGLGESVTAKGFLERGGRSIFFSRGEAWVDGKLLIASAQGTFKYSRPA